MKLFRARVFPLSSRFFTHIQTQTFLRWILREESFSFPSLIPLGLKKVFFQAVYEYFLTEEKFHLPSQRICGDYIAKNNRPRRLCNSCWLTKLTLNPLYHSLIVDSSYRVCDLRKSMSSFERRSLLPKQPMSCGGRNRNKQKS